jgi:hypothetical protein
LFGYAGNSESGIIIKRPRIFYWLDNSALNIDLRSFLIVSNFTIVAFSTVALANADERTEPTSTFEFSNNDTPPIASTEFWRETTKQGQFYIPSYLLPPYQKTSFQPDWLTRGRYHLVYDFKTGRHLYLPKQRPLLASNEGEFGIRIKIPQPEATGFRLPAQLFKSELPLKPHAIK